MIYFIISKTRPVDVKTFTEEIIYALQFVKKISDWENEALWVYLRGHFALSEEDEFKSLKTNA